MSCQALGWLNALVEATAPPAHRPPGARPQRLDTLYSRVEIDLLERMIRNETKPDVARDVLSFVRSGAAAAPGGEDALRSPSFIAGRARAVSSLRNLPCGEMSSAADRVASARMFAGIAPAGADGLSQVWFHAARFARSPGAKFGLMTLFSFGLLALAFSRMGRDQRRTKRFPCLIAAKFQIADEWIEVTVIDFSQGGCRIVKEDPPNIGAAGMLILNDTECPARIVWVASNTAGLQFDADLPHDLLKKILARRGQAPRAAPSPSRAPKKNAAGNQRRL